MRQEILLRSRFIKAWPGQVSTIEPTIGSTAGFPDAWLSGKHSGFAEFKVIDPDCVFELEPTQRLWLLENLPHYRRVVIVCLDERGCYISSACSFLKAGRMELRNNGCGGRFVPWAHDDLPFALLQACCYEWS